MSKRIATLIVSTLTVGPGSAPCRRPHALVRRSRRDRRTDRGTRREGRRRRTSPIQSTDGCDTDPVGGRPGPPERGRLHMPVARADGRYADPMASDEEFLGDLNEAMRDRPLDLTRADDRELYVPVYDQMPPEEDPVKLLANQIRRSRRSSTAHLFSGYKAAVRAPSCGACRPVCARRAMPCSTSISRPTSICTHRSGSRTICSTSLARSMTRFAKRTPRCCTSMDRRCGSEPRGGCARGSSRSTSSRRRSASTPA